ncbi:MAG: FAD-dependent oxidoreductase [Fimbriimonas sp.]
MATKPAIVAVDDDPEVLAAVERDLRRHYGARYRVVRADSGASALTTIGQLRQRNEPIALVLSDQKMPGMSGTDLLKQVRKEVPDAKRVLLTAYSDTEAAIEAINLAKIDNYLRKPWDPPEQNLFPTLDDLLEDWKACFRPPFEGVRLVGLRWAPETHALKTFLGQHQIPFEWLEPSQTPKAVAEMLGKASAEDCKLPVVVLANGEVLERPCPEDLAEKLGVRTRANLPFYDLAIVGGGPAGLAAAVYGASEGLTTVLIEREAPGGQASQSSRIENYLGFPSGLTGKDLARRAQAQAARFGVEILNVQEASEMCVKDGYKVITLEDASTIAAKALVIATGVQYRQLDAPGVKELTGSGIYYGAAITEAIACKDEEVFIVGGANSAGQAAVYLAGHAKKVTILVRGTGLEDSMSRYLIDEIGRAKNIELRPRTVVDAAEGEEHLERVRLKNLETGETETCPAAALFIFIGAVPRTDWLSKVLVRDDHGFIVTGPDIPRKDGRIDGWPLAREPYLLEACVPGVFVAGDVRAGSVKRIASGVGEGSVAIQFVHRYLAEANA